MTTLLYLEDPNMASNTAKVIALGANEIGNYIITEQTCFYPGGGGQEPDKGTFTSKGMSYEIIKVSFAEGSVYHYAEDFGSIKIGDQIEMNIDQPNRILNSKLHTAGHLISSIIHEEINPSYIPLKGFHYQSGPNVQFSSPAEDYQFDLSRINERIQAVILEGEKVSAQIVEPDSEAFSHSFKISGFIVPRDKPLRLVKIGNFLAYPCGGTHASNTSELNGLVATKISKKKGDTKVSYRLNQ